MSHNKTIQPSIKAIKQMFSALIMMGVKLPPAWENMDKTAIVQVWQSALTGMSDEDLTAATFSYTRGDNAQWFPTPNAILKLQPASAWSQIDDSDEAWGAVLSMVSRYGRMNKPEKYHSDPKRHQCIEAGIAACGGWVMLGLAQEERMAAHRASFRSAYRSCKARKHWRDETRALSIAFPDLQVLTGKIGNDTE